MARPKTLEEGTRTTIYLSAATEKVIGPVKEKYGASYSYMFAWLLAHHGPALLTHLRERKKAIEEAEMLEERARQLRRGDS